VIDGLRSYPAYRKRRVPGLDVLPKAWLATTLRRRLRPYDGIKIGPFGSQLKLEGMVATGYKVYGQANVIAADFERGNKHIDVSKFRELQSCEVRPGDLLITMMGTSGRCARVPEGAPAGIMDSHLLRLRPDADIDPDFLALVLDRAVYLKDQIRVAGKGSIMEGLNSSMVKDLVLALPSMPEQAAIVRFLDHADRRIRRYIVAKRKLIALLNEQKQAITHRAVTRGLDPDVRLKPSGVEGLGDLPEHWSVRKLNRLTDPARPVMYGIVLPGPNVDDGVFIVKGGNCEPGRLRAEMLSRTTFQIEAAYARSRLRHGDIVFAIRGGVGAAEMVPPEVEGANLTQDAARIAAGPGVHPGWLLHSIRAPAFRAQVEARVVGATVRGINIRDLKRIDVPVPPSKERAAISDYLDATLKPIDVGRDRLGREISLVGEYRTRLIADVVTGKLDVRDAATRLPDEFEQIEPLGDVNAPPEGEGSEDEAALDTETGEIEG
jgi:type I restriction enzyme, S subunit